MFGLVPDGHPNPTRVSLHDDWPDGEWALRKDFPDDRKVAARRRARSTPSAR